MAATPILAVFNPAVVGYAHVNAPVCRLIMFASMLATVVCSPMELFWRPADVCVFQWKSGEMLLVSGTEF